MTGARTNLALGAAIRAVRTYGQRVGGFSRNLKLYLGGAVLRSVAFATFELLFSLYLLSLGFDAAFIGLANTSRGIASMICSLSAGLVAERIGRRRAMIGGFLGVALVHVSVSVYSRGWAISGP